MVNVLNYLKNQTQGNFKIYMMPIILGIFFTQKISIGGEFYVGELIALIFIFINLGRIVLDSKEKILVLFAFLWSFAQLASDIINNTYWLDSIKGIFAPVFFVATILLLVHVKKYSFKLFPSFLIGILIGGLVEIFFSSYQVVIDNPWKWGLGGTILSFFLLYASFFEQPKMSTLIIFMLLFMIVSLSFGGRSLALFPLMALILFNAGRKATSEINLSLSKSFKYFIIVCFFVFILNIFFTLIFSSDLILSYFDDAAKNKYKIQSGGEFGFLLGGRSEILASFKAFIDKPFLGHGSWAKDNGMYIDYMQRLLSELKYESLGSDKSLEFGQDLIPVHSFIMGGFVWAGFFGGLFWIVFLFTYLNIFLNKLRFLPLYFYNGTLVFVWNIFFSPFGSSNRFGTAIFIGCFFSYINFLESKKLTYENQHRDYFFQSGEISSSMH